MRKDVFYKSWLLFIKNIRSSNVEPIIASTISFYSFHSLIHIPSHQGLDESMDIRQYGVPISHEKRLDK